MNRRPLVLAMTYSLSLLYLIPGSGAAQSLSAGQIALPNLPQFNVITPLTRNPTSINSNNAEIMKEVESFRGGQLDSRRQVEEALMDFDESHGGLGINSPNKYRSGNGYHNALQNLLAMESLPDSVFSITNAVYNVENAYFDQKLPYDQFIGMIRFRTSLCKDLLRKERLDSSDNLAKNYVIQKLFTDTLSYYDLTTKRRRKVAPLKYDFEDYKGQEHWENMFVTKLLFTGKGQCHSLPLLYLMVAEDLGAEAFLSTAPEHSYIQFQGPGGRSFNFETTSGMLVSNNWLMQSGFINTAAIKRGTYLNTLDRRKLLAYVIMDLTMGYIKKYGYDSFVDEALKHVKQFHPDNLSMLLLEANIVTQQTMALIKQAGSPPQEKLSQYPTVYDCYKKMVALYDRIDDLGFQAMPSEAYQAWLKSVKIEKQKQLNRELQSSLQPQLNNKTIKLSKKN